MINKITKALVCLLLLCISTDCTQFNGYIGDLFGSWVLDGIEAQGNAIAPELDPSEDYFLSFQTNIVFIESIDPYNVLQTSAATWVKADGKMCFDFDHDDDDHFKTSRYGCPAWFGPKVLMLEWTIVEYTSKRLTLQRSVDGGSLIYRFSKTI